MLSSKWCGKHIRFDDYGNEIIPEVHQEGKFSRGDLDGIDFAMWDCDPVTFTYKDLEVTMVAYNTDCLEKDEMIAKKEKIISDQNKVVAPKFITQKVKEICLQKNK